VVIGEYVKETKPVFLLKPKKRNLKFTSLLDLINENIHGTHWRYQFRIKNGFADNKDLTG